jgi:hypothetical protein
MFVGEILCLSFRREFLGHLCQSFIGSQEGGMLRIKPQSNSLEAFSMSRP